MWSSESDSRFKILNVESRISNLEFGVDFTDKDLCLPADNSQVSSTEKSVAAFDDAY
jgi:hypothetical protein